jgi:hypothetical protein
VKTSAEVWEEYLPRLAEAREQDRENITRAFLPVVVPLGSFKIVPLTIERLLWLETAESPFLTGERDPTKEDVLAFLWICSPDFRVGYEYGRRFCRRHFFIRWRMYAVKISELIMDAVEMMGSVSGKGDGAAMSYDWLPTFIDGVASQYHWSENEIMNIPLTRVGYYVKAMMSRMNAMTGSKGGGLAKFSPKQDAIKAEYLRAVQAAATEEAATDGR